MVGLRLLLSCWYSGEASMSLIVHRPNPILEGD